MSQKNEQAAILLREFKGDAYVHGLGCLERLGEQAAALGSRASVVTSGIGSNWAEPIHGATCDALQKAGVAMAGPLIPGAKPNAPREDVFRIAMSLANQQPDVLVAVGGGSGIDGTKAAAAFLALGEVHPEFDDFFGVGQVSKLLEEHGREVLPMVAVQLASGSAAHLTKYSNITDPGTGQKMLIVDEAVVPPKCLFDYTMTATMSTDFTMDGGLDGVAHCLEVLYGVPDDKRTGVEPVSLLGIDLIVNSLKAACVDPDDLDAREALGLGTDLGGYAIMLGGTNGAHLNSFSLVDILSHGRACALMNPYYTVFFAPAIKERLRAVGAIYKDAGYTSADLDRLSGRDLGMAVAEAMVTLSREVGFPTTLAEVSGFTPEHVARALTAAKNPKLEMKLRSMPVPLTAETVDDYMGPILEAARTGDFEAIRNM
jgi:alcohol dehydrogenase class IV